MRCTVGSNAEYDGLRNLKECLDKFGIQYQPEEQSEDAAPE